MAESGVSWRGLVRVARHSTGKMPRCGIWMSCPVAPTTARFYWARHTSKPYGGGRSRAVINQADGILTTSSSDGSGAAHPVIAALPSGSAAGALLADIPAGVRRGGAQPLR